MKKIFDTRFNIGASSAEPPIRDMILRYYTSHGIPLEQAQEFTNAVIAEALKSEGE